ncbi:MAG: ABC transporter ATP-binding protein [Verrucomicrobiota bacterium]
MVELRGVEKNYRMGRKLDVKVLNGINMQLSKSEQVSICGASGSGKSTLLHILGGLDRPTRGSYLWEGQALNEWSRATLAKWRNQTVGFVFQSYHLLPELTALENVMLPGALARKSCKKDATELLDHMGLYERMEHRPNELSGGEQQRVAIARSLINDPELILADEPTGNLDSQTSQIIMKLLLDLSSKKKKALVFVTHDQNLADKASTMYILADGNIKKR